MLSVSPPSLRAPLPLRFSSAAVCRRRTTVSAVAGSTMYELLSVAETARPEEIKAAYRRQAQRWHPDVCPASGDKGHFARQFMRAREAYELLSDPVLREGYDLALSDGMSADRWAAAVAGGVAFRKGSGRDRSRFGNWESQLEGLKRRSAARSAAAYTSESG